MIDVSALPLVGEEGLEGIGRSLSRRLVDGVLVVAEEAAPAWLEAPDAVEIVRYTGEESRYVTSLPETEEIVVAPDEPFRRLDCYLTDVDRAAAITVAATFVTADGDRIRRSNAFTNGDRFDFDDHPLPISLVADAPAVRATLTVDVEPAAPSRNVAVGVANRLSRRTYRPRDRVRVSRPAPRCESDRPPIVLLSIDTLRYDQPDALAPIVDALGEDAVVPAEPRTQGNWTSPAHASMVTGVHPGDHTYVGGLRREIELDAGAGVPDEVIHPALTTLPELLADAGYTCSGLVSHTRLLPEQGFGRGCYRYRLNNLTDWIDRDDDAAESVETLRRWLDRDVAPDATDLFYFCHLFDPHSPYLVPDAPDRRVADTDLSVHAAYSERCYGVGTDYMALLDADLEDAFDDHTVDTLRTHYREAVRYAAEQVARLVGYLREYGLYDDALVIVTGDHGEEFCERGFFGHNSLYDANIRPFMAIKPPSDADWTVPDTVDTIDFLPTVARAIGVEPPAQCRGRPLQDAPPDDRPRYTERIRATHYNVAVERDGIKAIYTFESDDYPDRPTPETIHAAPVHEEYYRLDDVRDGDFTDCRDDLSARERDEFLARAREFAAADPVVEGLPGADARGLQPTQETHAQLEHLGYR